ncbi:MAG TPA: hypothetical protein VKQ36_06840 [Ktedonobacterales bacterium]|nr:hypothetical protein [Ktedonobacterales bacterium]
MGKKSNLYVLLDVNIIIQAHVCGVWEQIVSRVTLVMPSIVVGEATHYTDPESGVRMEIHLDDHIANGSLIEVAATPDQLTSLRARFDRLFLERMDAGEAEALALLLAGELPDHRFCTGDGPAIKALALLDMADTGLSFEALLRDVGLQRGKIPLQYTEKFFQDFLARGAQDRIQGVGIAKPTPAKSATASRTRRKRK